MLSRVAASFVRVGFPTLRVNPLRTVLATSGVIMGVASLVAVLLAAVIEWTKEIGIGKARRSVSFQRSRSLR